jgi:hypothetical protein
MMPNRRPVHENQISMTTSYQTGTAPLAFDKCWRSVRMYGALGKKISQRNAVIGMMIYTDLRASIIVYVIYDMPKGIQARKRFQMRKI